MSDDPPPAESRTALTRLQGPHRMTDRGSFVSLTTAFEGGSHERRRRQTAFAP
jgi:hypothetical protein